MRIVVLTSDILDGRVVVERLLDAGRNIRGIIYEKEKRPLKKRIKFFLLFLLGKIKYINYEDIPKKKRQIIVRATDDINSRETIGLLKDLGPELIVVVGTRKLKREVFSIAARGAINMHSGILPFYRGADSEFWALYNNEPQMVGVTIHFVEEGLDSGDIILMERRAAEKGEDHYALRKKNISLGAEKINEAVGLLEEGSFTRTRQDEACARSYHSATRDDIEGLSQRIAKWQKRSFALKAFAGVKEEVASRPLIESLQGLQICYPRTFCLRIDADEYEDSAFNSYLGLFRKYKDGITIFVNADSFSHARDKIAECRDIGVDIQSHGFYHYTYSDYESNRYNIKKARLFFEALGIATKGFAAPMGRWNKNLMRALEDEGYEYSSDFAYDYLGLPSHPSLGDRISDILEIPIFPVCPELFFQKGQCDLKALSDYYKEAIDEMERCGIPVIVYAHTSHYRENPILMERVADYAVIEKGLRPIDMTQLHDWWEKRPYSSMQLPIEKRQLNVPKAALLGETVDMGLAVRVKDLFKRSIDFERVTPDDELHGLFAQRLTKRFFRKILQAQ